MASMLSSMSGMAGPPTMAMMFAALMSPQPTAKTSQAATKDTDLTVRDLSLADVSLSRTTDSVQNGASSSSSSASCGADDVEARMSRMVDRKMDDLEKKMLGRLDRSVSAMEGRIMGKLDLLLSALDSGDGASTDDGQDKIS